MDHGNDDKYIRAAAFENQAVRRNGQIYQHSCGDIGRRLQKRRQLGWHRAVCTNIFTASLTPALLMTAFDPWKTKGEIVNQGSYNCKPSRPYERYEYNSKAILVMWLQYMGLRASRVL